MEKTKKQLASFYAVGVALSSSLMAGCCCSQPVHHHHYQPYHPCPPPRVYPVAQPTIRTVDYYIYTEETTVIETHKKKRKPCFWPSRTH